MGPSIGASAGMVVSPAFVAAGAAYPIGPMPAQTQIEVAVGLSPSDPTGLSKRSRSSTLPGSVQSVTT